jgi:hypothetical protein
MQQRSRYSQHEKYATPEIDHRGTMHSPAVRRASCINHACRSDIPNYALGRDLLNFAAIERGDRS